MPIRENGRAPVVTGRTLRMQFSSKPSEGGREERKWARNTLSLHQNSNMWGRPMGSSWAKIMLQKSSPPDRNRPILAYLTYLVIGWAQSMGSVALTQIRWRIQSKYLGLSANDALCRRSEWHIFLATTPQFLQIRVISPQDLLRSWQTDPVTTTFKHFWKQRL